MATKGIDEVLEKHAGAIMSVPGVIGTAQGLCGENPCIIVFVIKMTADLEQKIPKNLNGYQVVLKETGEIKSLPGK